MLSERKIRKINEHLDEHISKNQGVRAAHLVQNSEPFSREISPYTELMETAEDFTSQNLVSLGDFLNSFPGKAQGYYDKCENYIQELQNKELELKREFGGPRIDILLGKLKNLRKFLVQKI